jgi:hypothetical protein
MDAAVHKIRSTAVRLERYCRRVKNGVWEPDRDDLVQALADCAEAAEIARRL